MIKEVNALMMGLFALLTLLTGCHAERAFDGVDGAKANPLVRIEITSTVPVGDESELWVGESMAFMATGVYQDGGRRDISNQVTWTSANSAVAEIAPSGLLTGREPGNTSVLASFQGLSSNVVAVQVNALQVLAISVTPDTVSVAPQGSEPLTAMATYGDGSQADVTERVSWQIGDETVAVLSQSGVVTGLQNGSTTATAALDGVSSNVVAITVSDGGGSGLGGNPLVSLQITPTPVTTNGVSELTLAKGNVQPFAAVGIYKDGTSETLTNKVNWIASDSAVADLSAKGVLTALKPGSMVVRAELSGIESNAVTITVTSAVITEIQVTPADVVLAKGQGRALRAVATYSDHTSAEISEAVQWLVVDSAIVTVSTRGELTAHRVGTTTVTAVLGEVSSNPVAVTVTDAVIRRIQLTPSPVALAKGQQQAMTAMAIFSDNSSADITATVSWMVADMGIIGLSPNGMLRALEKGSTTLSASQNGVVSNVVAVTVSDAVVTAIQVTPASLAIAKGNRRQMTALATYSDNSVADVSTMVTWASMDTEVATVTTTGLLRGMAVGDTEVTATLAGITSNRAEVAVSAAVVTAIQVTPASLTLAKGQRQSLTAMATYSDGHTQEVTDLVAWHADDRDVATVSTAGELVAVDVGNTEVTAWLDGVQSNGVSVELTAAVITALQVTPSPLSLAKGRQQPLVATARYSDNTTANVTSSATWVSADTARVTVTATGLLSAVGLGDTTVTASLSGVTSNRVAVTVTAAVITAIQVTPSPVQLAKGNRADLTAMASYSDGTSADVTASVAWRSADTAIATVADTGQLTAVAAGSTSVTARQAGVTSNVVQVEVGAAAITAIQVTPAAVTLAKGNGTQLSAMATYSDGTTVDVTTEVDWISQQSGVATITASGRLQGVAQGSTRITASKGGVSSNAVPVEVTTAVITAIQVTPASLSLAKGARESLVATAIYSDGSSVDISTSASWVSTETGVATITDSGLLSAVAQGTSAVTAAKEGVISNTVGVTVTAAVVVSIDAKPDLPGLEIVKGLTGQATAEATYSDGTKADVTSLVAWQSTNTGLATVSTTGLVSGVASGETTVTAAYRGYSDTVKVVVSAAQLVEVILAPSPLSLMQGQSQNLTVTGRYSDGTQQDLLAGSQSISWSVGDGTLLSVSDGGVITAGSTTGSTTLGAIVDGISSNQVDVTVSQLVSVCGHTQGNPIGTGPGGGINDTDSFNGFGDCLKVRQITDPNDGVDKWFSGAASTNFAGGLGYQQQDSADNSGDTYGETFHTGIYAGFRHDGQGVAGPASGDESVASVGGQADRWCQKLAAIGFAGRDNWRLATLAELIALYEYDNAADESLYSRFGWPYSRVYWSQSLEGTSGYQIVDMNDGTQSSLSESESAYTPCVAPLP
ncbi:Ig domain protein group 2 domain protein [Ferrimonas balearica DSM 9799]|uniref:Ig domain protein group 2 domain protein n=1 Tax=Ferrimonas balearica (strain DSM 9799 / CCM 4581 / KCTC 23876 / PAT) TaxID=550540 RepID=E1SSE8_FERBD|nr:Ig-like domain-containing protein [Ferrimonas balearica]ADN74988.1 Ig domain protein group 2 domain protein [Ferrimonas balearica DSM 9799]